MSQLVRVVRTLSRLSLVDSLCVPKQCFMRDVGIINRCLCTVTQNVTKKYTRRASSSVRQYCGEEICGIFPAYKDEDLKNLCVKVFEQCSRRIVNSLARKYPSPLLENQATVVRSILRERLQVTDEEIIEIWKKFPFFLQNDVGRTLRTFKILEDNEVSTEAILRDLWLFRHNEEMMRQRVEIVREAGVPMRTWLLRCSKQVFDRHVDKHAKREEVLRHHTDIVDYLAARLECSEQYILNLSHRHPRLLSINPPKLAKLLDYLFREGYTSQQICLFPRVLSCSASRIQTRIEAFKVPSCGKRIPALPLLNVTDKEFQRTLTKFEKKMRAEGNTKSK